MHGTPSDKVEQFLATDEWILSEESEFAQQKKPTMAVDGKEVDRKNESYASSSTESSGQNYVVKISFIACITTGFFLLILACMIMVLLAVASSSNPSSTTVPCLHSLTSMDPVSSLLLDKMGTSSQLLGNMYANVSKHLSGFIQDQLVKYANVSDHLSSLFRDKNINGTNSLLLYCRRCFNSNSTSFFDNSTLTRALKCGLKAVLIGVGMFVVLGVDFFANVYQFIARCSSSFFNASSSAGPRRNASLTRLPLILFLVISQSAVVEPTAPNTTVTNELGFPLCTSADEVKYEKCLPSEFEPESDMCPVTTPQSVNYVLPQLDQFLPVLVQMHTTEEGGGQIPGACTPGSVLPPTMGSKSVLLLCIAFCVLGPVSPVLLLVCVTFAHVFSSPCLVVLDLVSPPPWRRVLESVARAFLFVLQGLGVIWNNSSVYLNVGVAKTSACLYHILRLTFWIVGKLVNYRMRSFSLAVLEVSSDSSSLRYPSTTSSKEYQDLPDDACYVYPTQGYEGAQVGEDMPVANVQPSISSSRPDQVPTLKKDGTFVSNHTSMDEGNDIRDPTSSDQVPVLADNSANQTDQASVAPVFLPSFPPKLPRAQTEEENPSFPPANAEAVSEKSLPDQQDAQMVYDPINSTIPELAGKQVRVASSRGFPPTECGELRDDAMMSSVVHRASGTPDGLYCSEATLVEKGPVPAAKTPGKTVYRNYFPRR